MSKPYTGPADETCPLRGGKLCAKVCPTCKFQTEFHGRDVATQTPRSRWDCAFFMQHTLQIEGNMFAFQNGASIDAFKNEVVVQNRQAMSGAVKLAERALNAVGTNEPSQPLLASDTVG